MDDKYNHHFLPRLYLKGFACDGDPSHIWEYRRFADYCPGSSMPDVRAAVHTLKGGVGFTKPYSELTFPISSRVVLIGSYRNVRAGYVSAGSELVKEVNRRLIATAKTFAYCSRNRKWIITIMKKNFHRFNFFYPAPELSASLVV
ncbi:MAG: hypothetical protein QOG23_3294 [Blastocatellia bacterium]|jgi:hypothetical protein|nr:hypothetical protein [Blastocatellia bacterium]